MKLHKWKLKLPFFMFVFLSFSPRGMKCNSQVITKQLVSTTETNSHMPLGCGSTTLVFLHTSPFYG